MKTESLRNAMIYSRQNKFAARGLCERILEQTTLVPIHNSKYMVHRQQ